MFRHQGGKVVFAAYGLDAVPLGRLGQERPLRSLAIQFEKPNVAELRE